MLRGGHRLADPNERAERTRHHHEAETAPERSPGGEVLLTPAGAPAERVARARTCFLVDDPVEPGIVREPILASWTRSRQFHVAADHLELPYETDPERDSLLRRAAGPVIDDITDQFATEPMSVILTDEDGRSEERRVGKGCRSRTASETE